MKIASILLLYLLPFIGVAQVNYKIYNTNTQKTATLDEVVAEMNKADVLFYGEEHNDSLGHTIELAIFDMLVKKYPQNAALSLEMFETDTQPVVNEYLNNLIREKNLLTDARAWSNYKDYKPLVELAKQHQLPVIAANAPSKYTNRVTRLGLGSLHELDSKAKEWLPPLPIDTAAGAYYNKFVKTMGGHASMGGMKIYQSQNLWDATMAWSIAKHLKVNPRSKIMHINGGFHSEDQLGAAAQLKKYAPKARIINIAAYAVADYNNINWNSYSKSNNYIILTNGNLSKSF
ncbi:ChaN family lipoprotein [uncultured Mucilaginibacter sp.]|uniref:ChaN family lipoprotein n=1 Tax=uncultured Mucilaginibacter sp. TaxID=797541 RepID=UPI0025F4F0F9|nr:ChaN family lipoprotein [uncultured Mucilaginibacter sp.]